MIPLRDANPSRGFPFVNYLIIIVCIVVFLYELMLGVRLKQFFFMYGVVPLRYFRLDVAKHFTIADQIIPLFSSMFLHGGWLHLLGNMWTLYIFGDNVEHRLGHLKYLFFYLLSGVAAGFIHVVTNPFSPVPTVGASGAIAGVMGAYMVLFPKARVLTLIPIFFFLQFVELPAFIFLGLWFLLQFYSGALSIVAGSAGGIAWWAHIGGFIGGIVLLKFLKPKF